MRLSNLQYATLKYLYSHPIDVTKLGTYHQGVVGSLLYRGLIRRTGRHLSLTEEGTEILNAYRTLQPALRKVGGEMTERVQRLLKYAKIRQSKNAA